MFQSHNGNEPIANFDQALNCRLFSIDFESNNPTSKQENNCDLLHPPLSFFHFPSPFEDNEIFLEPPHNFPLQYQQPLTQPEPVLELEIEPQPVVNKEVSIKRKLPGKGGKNMTKVQIPKKGRDRHSKISTARGLRDRRMRLSLEVAKRFFGLQDMLGFDKASKTVEWLLNKATVEINQLAAKGASSTSECEGISSLEEVVVNTIQETVKRKVKRSRKSAFHPLAKKCREKARERARERTKEKMRSKQGIEETNHKLIQWGSWNPFETGEESGSQSHSVNPSLDFEGKEHNSLDKEHLGTVETTVHDDSLPIMNKRNQPMIFSSLINSGFFHEVSLK